MKAPKPTASFPRRRFIGNTLKIALLGAIISPLEQACNNNKNKSKENTGSDTSRTKTQKTGKKKNRKTWSHESLVLNSKSGVMHLPTSKVYHYYDEIKSSNIQNLTMAAWASQLNEKNHINKQQSGNILELITLNQLKQGVNDEYLNAATDTLSRAFSESCNTKSGRNMNEKNFRLHELMLQLIALNTSIPRESKWQTFNSKIKKPENLRKRQTWMATEAMFNDRIQYILDHQSDYMNRLTERARKYSFT